MTLDRSESYEFATFHLDVPERLLKNKGEVVPLSEKIFETLCALVRRGGSLVTKDELLSSVWPDTVVEENNLDKSISRLRQILGERKGEHTFIETVRGHGYRFVIPVRTVDPSVSGPVQDGVRSNSGTVSKDTKRNSIAVLSFKNLSPDPENEYFCDGLAEEILNGLTKTGDLKVAARTSAFSFKDRDVDVAEIGRVLKVKNVLEGSVRKSGDRLRVAVQLINAHDGYQIWSEIYDGEMREVFELQERIARSVTTELKVKFDTDRLTRHRVRYAENIEAYQLYLKGRYHFLKLTPPDTLKGIAYFQKAIEIEPDYALAYAGLAGAYITFPMSSDGLPSEFFPKAKRAAEKAIEIDDQLSEAYAAKFWSTFWFDWNWKQALEDSQTAIRLYPQSPDGHEGYAHVLSNIGRHDEAIAAIRDARALDPLHLRINALEGQFLLHSGRVDEAIDMLMKTLEFAPRFWLAHLFLSSAFSALGNYPAAVASADSARALSGSTHPIAFSGYALAKMGKVDEATSLLNELLDLSSGRYIPSTNIAMIQNGLGDEDAALDRLELAFSERDPRIAFLKVEPKWDNLRSTSRFKELIKKLDLE